MKILTNTRATLTGLAVAAVAASGIALAAPASAAPVSVWDRVAACESGGNWHINTGNGYYGGLQFSLSTWHGYGGAGNPASASKSEQIRIAEKVLAGQGWGAWPVCSVKAGATGYASTTHSTTSHATTSHKTTSHATTTRSVSSATPAPRYAHVKLSGKTYRVKSGDTLAKIAAKRHVSGGWHRLAAANPQIRNVNLIFVGQRLHLPA